MSNISPPISFRSTSKPTAISPTSLSSSSTSHSSKGNPALSSSLLLRSSSIPPSVLLEICVDSVASAVAAEKGGANRLEVCSGLTDGGVTPSYGLISSILSHVAIPIHVLIRPRPGDFLYNDIDISIMQADIQACKLLGVSGVVIGCLTPQGRIDQVATETIISTANPMSVTFHRAIDLARDDTLCEDIDILVSMGVQRILTSGLAADVEKGKDTIKKMVDYAAGRIVIMAGGGISIPALPSLLQYTNITEIHTTARSLIPSPMVFKREGVYMGGEKFNTTADNEAGVKVCDTKMVKEYMKIIANIPPRTSLSLNNEDIFHLTSKEKEMKHSGSDIKSNNITSPTKKEKKISKSSKGTNSSNDKSRHSTTSSMSKINANSSDLSESDDSTHTREKGKA